MQSGEFLVTSADIGVSRALCHFAALLRALTVIR
jgi:hypothetical protein